MGVAALGAIIPSVIGAGASLIGGGMGAGASAEAARIQAASAAEAAKQARELLGTVNPPIAAATTGAQQTAMDAALAAATGVTGAAQQGQAGALGAAGTANQMLAPYLGLGGQAATTLAGLMAPGGDLTRTFTAQDMAQQDPGYQFRLDQAAKAVQASAAARGGALGGGTLRSLTDYSQNVASSEYQNAFNRFMAQQQQRFGQLNTLANMGVNVSGMAGQNLIGANQYAGTLGLEGARLTGGFGTQGAQFAGQAGMTGAQQQAANAITIQQMITDALTGGANARAAGVVGGANAWQQALGGVAGAAGGISQYYQNQQIMQTLAKLMGG